MKILKAIDKAIGAVVNFLGLVSMALLFIILIINVIIRVLHLGISLSWYSEVVEILFAWMVMIGAVALCRNADHFRVDLFLQKFGDKRGYYWLEAICYFIALCFYACFLVFSFNLAVNAPQTMPVLKIPKGFAYACMPVSAALMCIYAVRDVIVAIGRALGKIPMIKTKNN